MQFNRRSQNFNFAIDDYLDPALTFSRPSSATHINKQTGLLELLPPDTPRLERDGLLIEGASTNLCPKNAIDFVENGSVVGTVPAPDGTNTAQRVSKTNWGRICSGAGPLPAGDYVFSVWVRAVAIPQRTSLQVNINNDTDGGLVDISPTTAWARYSLQIKNAPAGINRLNVLATDGVLELWGWQIEPGLVATSYIPTAGAPATRAAETCFLPAAGMGGLLKKYATIIIDAELSGAAQHATLLAIGTGTANAVGFEYYGLAGESASGCYYWMNAHRWPYFRAWKGARLRAALAIGAAGVSAHGMSADSPTPVEQFANATDIPDFTGWNMQLGADVGSYSRTMFGHIRSIEILPWDLSPPVLAAKLTVP